MEHVPFDPQLVAERAQLFPDRLCLDPCVVYHGTSGVNEARIDSEGLRWNSEVTSREDLFRLTRIFEQMGWHGVSGGGYPVLEGFSKYDFGGASQKPVFLGESSYRAMAYACLDFSGGETARGMRLALSDLRRYRASAKVREEHQEQVWHEYEQLKRLGARLPPEPRVVDLSWLDAQLVELSGLSAALEDICTRHPHGVVYAIRFDSTQKFIATGSLGLAIDAVPLKRIVAKVHVPREWVYDPHREDPHRDRALLTAWWRDGAA